KKGGILGGTTVVPGHRVVPNTGGGGRGEVIGVGLLRSVVDTHYPAPAGPEGVVRMHPKDRGGQPRDWGTLFPKIFGTVLWPHFGDRFRPAPGGFGAQTPLQ